MFRINKNHSAFTIVELLVVIVVIGILAAITIVSYTGMSGKATVASIQSELSNAKKQLNLYYVDHGVYPKSLNASNCPVDINDNTDNKYCIKYSTGTTYEYTPNNTTAPTSFCITTTANSISYIVTDTTSPKQGDISSFGLVGYWALDNTTGMTDLSGNGNNGTAYGGIAIGTAVDHRGVANKATTFDGSNDYVDINNVGNIDPVSFSLWFKPTVDLIGSSSGQVILGKDGSMVIAYRLAINTAGRLCFGINGGGAIDVVDSVSNLQNWYSSNWYHVVVTFSGNKLLLFVNGSQVAQKTTVSAMQTTSAYHTFLGTNWYNTGNFFNGLIDDVRIYNRALSQTEITNLYNSN